MAKLMLSVLITKTRRQEGTSGGDGYDMVLITVLVSCVHTYLQTYEVIYIKYVHFWFSNHTSIKCLFFKSELFGLSINLLIWCHLLSKFNQMCTKIKQIPTEKNFKVFKIVNNNHARVC